MAASIDNRLFAAICSGDLNRVKTLLTQEGMDPCKPLEDEIYSIEPPIIISMFYIMGTTYEGGNIDELEDRFEIMKQLLQCGAKVNGEPYYKSKDELNVVVSMFGDRDRMRYRGNDYTLPLYIAITQENPAFRKRFVSLLLQYGADPNMTCSDGKTLLEKARELGHDDIIDMMVAHSGVF